MTAPEYFTHHTAIYAPVGQATLDQAVAMIEKAIAHASASGFRALLVDVLQLQGMKVPSVVDRFRIARRWAKPAGTSLRVAIVCDPKYIHEDRVGVILGYTHGFSVSPFTNRADAFAWLNS